MDDQLLSLLRSALAGELEDAALAADLATLILEAGVAWKPPTIEAAKVDSIVAYAFGNRPRTEAPAPNAALVERLDLPGPVNEQLAETVLALHAIRPVRVFAQWEIAHVLARKHGLRDVVSIEPTLGDAGEVVYLSTEGVARAAAQAAGGAAALGTVAVVAHRDHAKRCVQISRGAGMNAFVADAVDLPADYDPRSGQTWTRRRDIYLLHDICAQLAARRAQAIARAFPDG